jgi:hypothetical protein
MSTSERQQFQLFRTLLWWQALKGYCKIAILNKHMLSCGLEEIVLVKVFLIGLADDSSLIHVTTAIAINEKKDKILHSVNKG